MKKLTIVLICFIGIALISYVIISLCFSGEYGKSGKEFGQPHPANNSLTHCKLIQNYV